MGYSASGVANTNVLLQMFGSLSWSMQKDRNLYNHDFKVELAWSISSEQRASGPGTLSDLAAAGHWQILPK